MVLWPLRIVVATWLGWRRGTRALAERIIAAVASEAATGLLRAGTAGTARWWPRPLPAQSSESVFS